MLRWRRPHEGQEGPVVWLEQSGRWNWRGSGALEGAEPGLWEGSQEEAAQYRIFGMCHENRDQNRWKPLEVYIRQKWASKSRPKSQHNLRLYQKRAAGKFKESPGLSWSP